MKEPESPFSEPIILPIEDSIDLHAFHPRDIQSVVEEYLEQCKQSRLARDTRIIHGRGTGVQRAISCVAFYRGTRGFSLPDAPARAGGWGASVVVLGRK